MKGKNVDLQETSLLYDCFRVVIVLQSVKRSKSLLRLSGKTWYFKRRGEQQKVFRIPNSLGQIGFIVILYIFI